MGFLKRIQTLLTSKPKPRSRRLLPDLIKVILAASAIIIGSVIWYQPPLIRTEFPHLSYSYQGTWATDAKLYRPLAMPTRYYIELPHKIANRYQWFTVDRRREVAALTDAPSHRLFGTLAIKRGAPLGLDLEFRKLEESEWQVNFFSDTIVFSNNFLTIRLAVNPPASPANK